MLLSLFLVAQASILSFSSRELAIYGGRFSDRTVQIILNEASASSMHQGQDRTGSEPYRLVNSKFRDLNGSWTDSSYTRYWEEKWGSYNCYSYAMQRYDIVPEYHPAPDYLPPSYTRWYNPGQIAHVPGFENYMRVWEEAEAVVEDFSVMGYTNVSAFRFTGVLPALGVNEELIAVRTTEPIPYDYHFMRYNKADGSWYHKIASSDVLKYKHALSEQLVWTNELPSPSPESSVSANYSSDIWLIKYTRPVLTVSADSDLYEPLYIDNIGDKVFALDVEEAGHLELSFWNVNGFSAVLYTEDWDALGVATYNPIEVDVAAGRHYLVMKNWRYCNDVYVSASLSPLAGGSRSCDGGRSFVISENESIILGRIVDGSLAEIGVEPIVFLGDKESNESEVTYL